jgi:hypothetical protein
MDSLDFKLKFLENVNLFTFVDGSVTESKIATGAVTETKIGTGAVTATKLASGVAASNLGFTPASTGKAIAMAIVFGS